MPDIFLVSIQSLYIPFCYDVIEGVDFIVNNCLTHFYFNSLVYLVCPISPFELDTLTLK